MYQQILLTYLVEYIRYIVNQSMQNPCVIYAPFPHDGTIHTRLMNNLNDLLLKANIIKRTVKQQEKFKLSNLTLQADLYKRNRHSNNDFAIYYPVQSALINAPDKLTSHIKDNHSKKIFIVTTNDWHSDTSILDDVIDETIILDIRTFDQEQYDILYQNLKGNMPY